MGLKRARVKRLTASKAERVPVDRPTFREVDQIQHAFWVEVSTGIRGTGQHEATPADFVLGLTGDMGHGIDQFEVTHDRASPWKGGKGQGKPPAARGADGENEKSRLRNDLGRLSARNPSPQPHMDRRRVIQR
jgi:hypothetical protein